VLTAAWLPALVLACLQGVLGIKVRIMKEWDPSGKIGPRTPLPDVVTVLAPKEEEYVSDKQEKLKA
jgi:ribosomal protein S3